MGISSLHEKSKKEYNGKNVCGKNGKEKVSKEGVLRNFAKSTRKHLCQSLVLMNILAVYYFIKNF